MNNPLLIKSDLPLYDQIKPDHIVPAIEFLIKENKIQIENLLNNNKTFTFENFVLPLELLEERLKEVWSVVSHLSSVVDTKELRKEHDKALPILIEYYTELGHDKRIYDGYLSLFESPQYEDLNFIQQKIIQDELRDFKLAGVLLEDAKKETFKNLNIELSDLENQFEKNVMDATDHWSLHIQDENILAGLPQSVKDAMQEKAKEQNIEGYRITLDFPTYDAIITHAENRQLRYDLYFAFTTIASNEGPHPKKWDNEPIMEKILNIRNQIARLLDFNNYAEYALTTRMLNQPTEILTFLNRFVDRVKVQGKLEYTALKEFALKKYNLDVVEPWDIRFLSEKLLKAQFDISEEKLRQYFPEELVFDGLFRIAEKLYGIKMKEIKEFNKWEENVRLFAAYDKNGELKGKFYTDLYARPHKRHGAWCGECKSRSIKKDGAVQAPVAYIVANFRAPAAGEKGLWSHDEVITLFHEFGHCLHHILTKIDYPSISGNNGVEWDGVELPSQFMENWCWEKESLKMISSHIETKESISDDLFKKLKSSKNFQIALYLLRQLEMAIFDMNLHVQVEQKPGMITNILNQVRQKVSVIIPPAFNRFQNSFSHIFAGGYAAGYYSYLWSEVLSADAFDVFSENGIFDAKTGHDFLKKILEMGASKKMMDLFIDFRKRPPSETALLKQFGINT